VDTGEPAYFNRYSYTANDPINAIDPDGMQIAPISGELSGDPTPPRRPLMTTNHHANLSHGARTSTNAIVLHRTGSNSAQSTLNHYGNSTTTSGTSYLIGRDGAITETAGRGSITHHVGRIKARCAPSCTGARVGGNTFSPAATHTTESALSYPTRFPTNGDSIGIEFVGEFDAATQTWSQATSSQLSSGRELVNWLSYNYGLDSDDVYHHDKISYKKAGEGAGLGYD
jgi:N-acetyl-anhydromuramyl-L-alanine amidase AmpD